MIKRRCKNKCKHYDNPYTLYQDGPMTPTGMITLRCSECGFLDFVFPGDDVDPETLLVRKRAIQMDR